MMRYFESKSEPKEAQENNSFNRILSFKGYEVINTIRFKKTKIISS